MPVVPRGAGTGPLGRRAARCPGCVVARALADEAHPRGGPRQPARCASSPGVINLDVSRRPGGAGYYYAPDPSSQSVCTIGGNVAENSGGAHCLKYGFTVNHVLRRARGDRPTGESWTSAGRVLDTPGYDLLGVVVGSEGTLGIVTEVVLRILRKPEATRTFFATFPSTDEAGACVSAIIGSGIVPAAIEMMDRLAIEAAKAATGLDWPDVGAALLMDVDGPLAEVEHTSAERCRASPAGPARSRSGARATRPSAMLMWKGRKSAFAAVGAAGAQLHRAGRRHPAHRDRAGAGARSTQLADERRPARRQRVPRRRRQPPPARALRRQACPDRSRRAEELAGGDPAHLHPVRRLDHRRARRGRRQGRRTWRRCSPRRTSTRWPACAAPSIPGRRCNPSKVFPTPRLCGDRPGPYRPHATERAGLADRG